MAMDWAPTEDSVLDDAALVRAARKRLLKMLEAEQAGNTVNNYVGGDRGGGGLMERMGGGGGGEDPGLYDYLVDIEKEDIAGPEGGKPIGWRKKVHRYRTKKGESGK